MSDDGKITRTEISIRLSILTNTYIVDLGRKNNTLAFTY